MSFWQDKRSGSYNEIGMKGLMRNANVNWYVEKLISVRVKDKTNTNFSHFAKSKKHFLLVALAKILGYCLYFLSKSTEQCFVVNISNFGLELELLFLDR